ncbi:MAG TPA: UDP-glucose 4-epimerase GalE [Verrucomicrobiae bacterium]|nr:UDP-glucose 4-epimerase GalE [Verrucomicrobiae bacterium]
MKVFVTGGAGYVGSVCVEELLNAGYQVTVFDNLSEGHRSAVDNRAEFVEGDLKNRPLVLQHLQRLRPDAVMHFASNTLVGASMTNPGIYLGDNISNAVNLLDACLAAGTKHFVFSSSCAIFGVPQQVPIMEDTPKSPINPYGESKLMVEKILAWYEKLFGIRYVCLRYFNAAGASERFGEHHREETHLIPNVLKVALGKTPAVDIYGTHYPTPDGTCIRDYVHIIDLAQAHRLALGATQSNVFNLGSGTGYSVKEIVEMARKISRRTIQAVEKPNRPGDPPKLVADSTKVRKVLGWKPRFDSIEPILESAWRWHLAHPNGYED